MLRVRKRKDGAIVLELEPEEVRILKDLPGRLRGVLESPDFGDRVIQRLFPAAYKDAKLDAEYRKLLAGDLVRRKLQAVEALESALGGPEEKGGGMEVVIVPERLDLCLAALNDMRLVLGTKLDIQEESWSRDLDPSHPDAYEMALLHYLSWLEEGLLAAAGVFEDDGEGSTSP